MKHRDIFAFMLGVLGGTVVAYTYFSSKYATNKDPKKEETENSSSDEQNAGKGPLRASESKLEEAEKEQKPEEMGVSMGFVDESELPEGFNKNKTSLGNMDEYLKQVTDYTTFSQNNIRPDVPTPPVSNGVVDGSKTPIPDDPPRFISYEEYESGLETNGHETLLYFVDSRTLTNEQEEIISDPEYLIGKTLYSLNDMDSPIFVRNYVLGIDYEITKIPGSWQ